MINIPKNENVFNIQKTTNYSQFSLIKGNRPIHAKELMESIKEKNLLYANPIIVTKNLEVVDGQHRLHCAKSLNLEIYYIVCDNLSVEDIPRLQIQKLWKAENFLQLFCLYRGEEYEFIQEIMKEYSFPIHFVINNCCSHQNGVNNFKKGTFKINKSKNKLREKFKLLNELTIYFKKIGILCKLQKNSFASLWTIVNRDDYDQDKMFRKSNLRKDELLIAFSFHSQANITDFILKQVYHFNEKPRKDKTAKEKIA